MRLLNTRDGSMRDFPSDDEIPPYAILSHTWVGNEEVTLQEWQAGDSPPKSGYAKIRDTQLQAARDGFDWVWIDTCCINKTSSAELSEAINSMFRWYQQATIAYAYLADVEKGPDEEEMYTAFAASRWFTRGWTLQEMLAPQVLVFFSASWEQLGTKTDLCDRIAAITGVGMAYLQGRDLGEASIGQRMAWAASRKTTRTEDRAYCLLGMFDVNMPLIYGEGKKAFRRLQEEILKVQPFDHSLFAWGTCIDVRTSGEESLPPTVRRVQPEDDLSAESWDADEARRPLMGMLAESPDDFAGAHRFVPLENARLAYGGFQGTALQVPQILGTEIRIDLAVRVRRAKRHSPLLLTYMQQPPIAKAVFGELAFLLCGLEDGTPCRVVLPLKRWRFGLGRTRFIVLAVKHAPLENIVKMHRLLIVAPQQSFQLDRPQTGDIVFRCGLHLFLYTTRTRPVTVESSRSTIRTHDLSGGLFASIFYVDHGNNTEWHLKVSRLPSSPTQLGQLTFSLRRTPIHDLEKEDVIQSFHMLFLAAELRHDIDHTVETPLDLWKPKRTPFSCSIRVERMKTDNPEATVDVIDLYVGTSPRH